MIDLKTILEEHAKFTSDETKGTRANLGGANLGDAYLRDANLRGANLGGANLRGANLRDADLTLTKGICEHSIVPNEGQFIVYKKAQNFILTLIVSKYAKRVGGLIGRKCRVSKVKLIKIERCSGEDITSLFSSIHSDFSQDFKYKVGKWITEPEFNDDIRVECTKGIHCFITKQEAKDY